MKPGIKLNKALVALAAACLLLAVMVPAVAAADYPHNGQFIAYYNPSAITTGTAPANAGTLYVNPAATTTKSAAANTLTKITTTTTPSSTDWPQFHYNAVHIGYSTSSTPSTNATNWTKNIVAIGATNPIVADGKVFVLTGYAGFDEPSGLNTINLTCIDESTGSILWNHALPRTVHYGSWSSPATDGNYVYVSSDYQHFAIDMSGNEVWNYTSSDVNVNGGPSIGGNNVFFSDWGSGSGGDYYSLNKATKALNWIFNNTRTTQYDMQYTQGSPAYDSSDGSVYVTGYTYSGASPNGSTSLGYLYKVNSTGYEVWSNKSFEGETFAGSATFDSSNVYVASYNFNGNGRLYAFDKSTGVLKWSNTTEATDATPAIYGSSVFISGGTAGYLDPGVRTFNKNSGVLKWSRLNEGMGGWTDSVSVANGYAFVGHESDKSTLPDFCYDKIYALNANTGATSWFYQQGGATAAIANGAVYTIGNNGYLYRFG